MWTNKDDHRTDRGGAAYQFPGLDLLSNHSLGLSNRSVQDFGVILRLNSANGAMANLSIPNVAKRNRYRVVCLRNGRLETIIKTEKNTNLGFISFDS